MSNSKLNLIRRRWQSGQGKSPGRKTAVTKFVLEEYAASKDRISVLDFGAGDQSCQTEILVDNGFDSVKAFDLPINMHRGLKHLQAAWMFEFDLVMASNVLNVQPCEWELRHTLKLLVAMTSGDMVCNYPASPRFMPEFKVPHIEAMLEEYFVEVDRVSLKKAGAAVIWVCRNPRSRRKT